MESQTIGCFAFKSDQQGLEYVNPCKRSFTHKTTFVHNTVEMTLAPALNLFSITLVFNNVGNNPAVPQHLPGFPRIKAAVSIEECASIVEFTPPHVLEQLPDRFFQLVTIIMVAGKQRCCRDNEPVCVRYWQNIAGLGFLSALIGDFFAPFFATLWLPSRLISDKFNSPFIVMILASKSFCRLPSLLHFRK